ncbi:MAG: hypothetical protein AABY22_23895, partial [Nanoarchaeota archaeon]
MFNHLSPTTFLKFYKQCEHRVYLEKVREVLSKEEYEKNQTMAMACGSAFDIMVKGALNRRIKVNEELKEKIQERNKAAIQLAKVLFECYSLGSLKTLKEEGIGFGSIDQEIVLEWDEILSNPPIQISEGKMEITSSTLGIKNHKSILYGMPDLTLKTGEVLDWKCQGMFGRGKKPLRGYCRCYLYNKDNHMHGKDLGENDSDLTMEEIQEDWAIQLYLYNRL